MNEQLAPGGIEWTRVWGRRGFTWHSIAGCQHACRWLIDGTVAACYAENLAETRMGRAYPEGFDHHYWRPHLLNEPLKLAEPSGIFLDSMSDLMGAWTPAEQVGQVLDVCRKASQHIFFLLTKNAPRLLQFDLPANVWPGVSMPPDFMFCKKLDRRQQEKMLRVALVTLSRLANRGLVTWMSFEPLAYEVSSIVAEYDDALRWAVIGAASKGKTYYQPGLNHVQGLLDVLDSRGVPVFMKGNLRWEARREEFPEVRNGRCTA